MTIPSTNVPDGPSSQTTPAKPEVHALPQQQPQPISLEDLIRLAGPLATAYLEHEERRHQREVSYETELLKQEVSWRKILLLAGSALGIVVFGVAGVLLYQGRDQSALDLIKLVVALAGAAFGGYGIARGRQRDSDSEE